MAKAPAKKAEASEAAVQLIVNEIKLQECRFNILSESPLIMNRFAQKAWQELLFPSKRGNRAALEQSLKHDPFAEYRGALYRNRDETRKSAFHIPNAMVHGALASAALDIPGAKKAQIERLTQVIDLNIDLYGVPSIFCAMVRSSDMARTPDVRTRPIFKEWACTVTVQYVKNNLTERTVANLLGAAGLIVGLGDWRPQKGGPYGRFKIVGDDNQQFLDVVKHQGRKQQAAAFEHPNYFDQDTEDLLNWFEAEVRNREMSGLLTDSKGRKGNSGKRELPQVQHVVTEGKDGEFIAQS